MSDKILIVDDLVTNRIILKVKLTAASHAVLQAATGAEALAQAARHRPALILLDMHLPDLSGIEVCRRLRANPALQHTPIIVISASTRRDCRLAALEAGADAFLTKPLNETVLMARIRNLLRASQTDAGLRLQAETCQEFGLSEAASGFEHPPRIALITPDPATARGWRAALNAHLPGDYALLAPAQALAECAGAIPPDLFVIAADPARPSDAMRLIADLRARDGGRAAGLCLALADPGQDAAALALDLGANDVVALPLDPQETALRLRVQLARQRRAAALRRAVQQGLELAATDPLTGLYNRRYALAHLDRIATRAAETGTQFAVMVLDLDRFKTVNDRFGHAAGDVVLATVAARLATALRPSDLVARVGGEEFLVALPDATLPMARAVAERLCAVVAQTPIALPDGLGLVSVTLSAGLTLGPDQELPVPPPCSAGGALDPSSARDPALGGGPGGSTAAAGGGAGRPAPADGSGDDAGRWPDGEGNRDGTANGFQAGPGSGRLACAVADPWQTGSRQRATEAQVPLAAAAGIFGVESGSGARPGARLGSGNRAGSGSVRAPLRDPAEESAGGYAAGHATGDTTGRAGGRGTKHATGHAGGGTAFAQDAGDAAPTPEASGGLITGTGPTALAARSALFRADTALLAAKGEGRNQVTILTAA